MSWLLSGIEGGISKGLEEELGTWVKERVAQYKRLREGVQFVDEIPKSAAGKYLRRILTEQAKVEEKCLGAKL